MMSGSLLSTEIQKRHVQETDIESKEETKYPYEIKSKTYYGRMAYIIFGFIGMILCYYLGTLNNRSANSIQGSANGVGISKIIDDARNEKTDFSAGSKISVIWASTIVPPKEKLLELCRLLENCFIEYKPDPINYPNEPYKNCIALVAQEHGRYDQGYFNVGSKLEGFISSQHDPKSTIKAFTLYNVCVSPESRERGIATKMIPLFLEKVVAERITNIKQDVYIGLCVNFLTQFAQNAFTNRDEILKNNLMDKDSKVNFKLCMIKLYNSDEFENIGRNINK